MSAKKWVNPSRTGTYYAWRSMLYRCRNPKSEAYEHYGGRGINVCDRWTSYDAFFYDMGERPAGMTLERKNNDDGYHPDNCVWATMVDQLNNQRRNRRIEHEGLNLTLSQWAKRLLIEPQTLSKRLDRMPLKQALREGSIRTKADHGNVGAYNRGCRCIICRKVKVASVRKSQIKAEKSRLKANGDARCRSRA